MKQKIKIRLILFCIIFYLYNNPLIAQRITYYSPEGGLVDFVSIDDELPAYIAAWNELTLSYISDGEYNAELIDNSSYTYNCYGYAWMKSENMGTYKFNASSDNREFTQDEAWSNDGLPSYVSASESEATHVVSEYWGHACRKIQNSYPVPVSGGRDYVSKWASLGLVRHEKHHDIYHDKDETRSYEFYKLKTSHSGTLTNYPKTWIGAGGITHTITSTVTVPSGVTLTIEPGATIKFAPGASLIVNGTLNVNGTSGNMVTFDRSVSWLEWGGIYFNSGSSGDINFANIKGANTAIQLTSVSNFELENSVIENNNAGLRSFSSSPKIKKNVFRNNNLFGVAAYLGSQPAFSINGGQGNNSLISNDWGIVADNNCFVYAGDNTSSNYNSIHSNGSWQILDMQGSIVYAMKNWWGTSAPVFSNLIYGSGQVYTNNYLTTQPPGTYSANLTQQEMSVNLDANTRNDKENLLSALKLKNEGLYNEASEVLLNILKESGDPIIEAHVLIMLNYCYSKKSKYKIKDFLPDYLNNTKNIKTAYDGLLTSLEAENMHLTGYHKNAVEEYENIIKKYPDQEYILKDALYKLSHIYKYFLHNDEKSKEYFTRLVEQFYDDKMLLGLQQEYNLTPSFSKNNDADNTTLNLSYGLNPNYPNPFNPTTIINYSIPVNSNVKISIYDIMGSLIKSFDFTSQSSGYHNVEWDGTNEKGIKVSSGTYIYRMEAVSLEGSAERFMQSKKMILIK